ncbi:MAG TPA: hypothetical protein PK794_07100, partial [Armatimonadota bacterium]|nr:hypothetical protein [Armatimonadota bacterium]
RLTALSRAHLQILCVGARASAGVLYGVYGLLERLGMGFYAGGDTFPRRPARAMIPADLDVTARPAFAARGNMLHYNFLCGPTTWGLHDYKFYFDQLARMRANTLLMHWYDGEPGAAYHVDGEYLTGGVTPNSLTKPWGAVAALRTAQFSFGTGEFFDEEIFSSPCGEDMPDLLTEIKRSEAMFRQATRYARGCAVKVAAGFEAPRTDPADPREAAHFQARVRQFLARNPEITHFALWQHESGACVGSAPPAPGDPGMALLEARREQFAYLGNPQRVWEAIRYGRFAELALEELARERSALPLVMVGWGGDRWMRFADLSLAYDRTMPDHVIFTCHDNIDASMGPNVSTPWGELSPSRERWAMPWVEGDISACDSRQPHVLTLGALAPDALKKGCQGLLTLQWRTRDVEEETGYIARFAWDTALTPEAFYREMARNAFGARQEEAMSDRLLALQGLGDRWTGVRGTGECSAMRWTGWAPHFPFELGPETAAYLIPKVEKAIAALADVPKTAETEAAFHLIQEQRGQAGETDETRPGVAELRAALTRLEALRGETDTLFLRRALRAIEEEVYALRPRLVAFGMTGKSYQAMDGFLIAIHHLWRNAGASAHMAVLRDLRADIGALRDRYAAGGRLARLERTEYLLATMDYALHVDSVAMLLADGEAIDLAIGSASAAREAHEEGKAAAIAAEAYTRLLAAGMDRALAAMTRKLTTRSDYGTLATLNVKPLPRYWETLDWLEAFLPAVPPREVRARGLATEVWLSWEPGRCDGQHLYRRRAGGAWARVNGAPLRPGCRMFLDTPDPGAYEYAVTGLAADGWESPRSHVAHAVCGPDAPAPRLVACKPFSRLEMGEAPPLRVTAHADRGIVRVTLYRRYAGETPWVALPMTHRFRCSYQAALPAERAGTLEFYVEAEDREGRTACWPLTGAALPWSATVA